jgi:hypothetical protein
MSFSIPSARYTDKADGINVKSLLGEQAVILKLRCLPRRLPGPKRRRFSALSMGPRLRGDDFVAVDRDEVN